MPLDGTNFEQQDEVLDLLKRAREMIARPGGWIQGHNRYGDAVCAVGAVFCYNKRETERAAIHCLERALPEFWHRSITDYNDALVRTQAEIIALYDRAIAMRDTPENGNNGGS